jgi:hypothetical protein
VVPAEHRDHPFGRLECEEMKCPLFLRQAVTNESQIKKGAGCKRLTPCWTANPGIVSRGRVNLSGYFLAGCLAKRADSLFQVQANISRNLYFINLPLGVYGKESTNL